MMFIDFVKKILKKNIRRLLILLINLVAIERNQLAENIRYFILRKLLKANVQKEIFIDYGFDLLGPKNITIGKYVSLGHNNRLWAFNEIIIGDYVQTAIGLLVVAGSHDQADYSPKSDQRVIIESGCWIGANVTIIGNVRIGKGSIIGAGSVVVKDIPEFSVAAGNPARVIRSRVPSKKIISPFGVYSLEELKGVPE